MAKYDALRNYLTERGSPEIRMTFGAVSELLTGGLPQGAYDDEAWWSDSPNASSWLDAGYEVSLVDVPARRVTFTKPAAPPPAALTLAADGLPADDDLRKTWELAGIGPITLADVQRFVVADRAHELIRDLDEAGLLEPDGSGSYTQVDPV
jgi:hypothetical protein